MMRGSVNRAPRRGANPGAALLMLLLCLTPHGAAQTPKGAGGGAGSPPPGAPQWASDGLVMVSAVTIDAYGRFIVGLPQENFEVFEDGVKREISYFRDSETRYSLFVILDLSGPLSAGVLSTLRRGVTALVETSNAAEVRFIVLGADAATGRVAAPAPREDAPAVVDVMPGAGLFDACSSVLQMAARSARPRQHLLIISNRLEEAAPPADVEALYRLARMSNATVYTLAALKRGGGAVKTPAPEGHPLFVLNHLSVMTGGAALFGPSFANTTYIFERLGLWPDSSYVIGYKPARPLDDGKVRRVKVRVNAPRGVPAVSVLHKEEFQLGRPGGRR